MNDNWQQLIQDDDHLKIKAQSYKLDVNDGILYIFASHSHLQAFCR